MRAASVLASRIAGARLELIDGAGHALILERRRQVVPVTLDFLVAHE